ncbi:MAG: hypothetical protein HUU02_02495 [Bacteroidetes bacterium]|nr:hypothetical protein [Bacteroidota bacterium]
MNMASVSLSPHVVLQHMSENQVRTQAESKTKSDKINAEATREAETVTQPKKNEQTSKSGHQKPQHIDVRI